MNKVLIATAWWPTKSKWFNKYSAGILSASVDVDTELFITTSFADSKFESIVKSMCQAEDWAKAHGHTHILYVEADKVLPSGAINSLLIHDKSVVLLGRGEEKRSGLECMDFARLIDGKFGWGAMLVKIETLNQVSFKESYRGDFISRDRAWFKRLLQLGVKIYLDHETKVTTLEPAEKTPQKSFKP
jgi:hypothetical protein